MTDEFADEQRVLAKTLHWFDDIIDQRKAIGLGVGAKLLKMTRTSYYVTEIPRQAWETPGDV